MSTPVSKKQRKSSLFWRPAQQHQEEQEEQKVCTAGNVDDDANPSLTRRNRIRSCNNSNHNLHHDMSDDQMDSNENHLLKTPRSDDFRRLPLHRTPPSAKKLGTNNYSSSRTVGIHWDPKTPEVHSNKRGNLTPSRYYNSPGGFALQRMLDGCMSPHVVNNHYRRTTTSIPDVLGYYDNGNNNGHEENDASRGSDATVSLAATEIHDWNECGLKLPSFAVGHDKNITVEGGERHYENYSSLVRGEVGVWDWSLKCHAKFECFPRNCIPGTPLGSPLASSSLSHLIKGQNQDLQQNVCNSSSFSFASLALDHDKIEQLAIKMFMNPDQSVPSVQKGMDQFEAEELVLAQWKAALMYWQHPAIHPLPQVLTMHTNMPMQKKLTSSLFSRNSLNATGISSGSSQDKFTLQRQPSASLSSSFVMAENGSSFSTSYVTPSLSSFVQDKMEMPLRRSDTTGRFGIHATNHLGTMMDDTMDASLATVQIQNMMKHRKFEWQKCFRSLFFQWMKRIRDLNSKALDSLPLSKDVSRCCFFSISSDHTVLFRPFYDTSHKHERSFQPMIVLSSSTRSIRSCLRSIGITIKIMTQNDPDDEPQYQNLTEKFVEEWIESNKSQYEEDEVTKQAREDLEALRRATTQGQTVGAGVSISMFKRARRSEDASKSNLSFPPLLILGHDDCMAFFELYTNTFGMLDVTTENEPSHDVPLLISRYFGPMQYMTLRHLTSSTYGDQKNDWPQNSTDKAHHLSFVDLHGPILPCALQDIISASAAHFFLHKNRYGTNEQVSESFVDENVLGSHYFMLNLSGHGSYAVQGSKHLRSPSAMLGSPSSMWFNGLSQILENDVNEHSSLMEHKYGKYNSMAVWDVNRPNSIAYKSSSIMPE